MKKTTKKEENNLWAEGFFSQTISSGEMEGKMKTFHKKHDEEMNFSCKKCQKKISAHNRDWHNHLCDDCFDQEYFPEE